MLLPCAPGPVARPAAARRAAARAPVVARGWSANGNGNGNGNGHRAAADADGGSTATATASARISRWRANGGDESPAQERTHAWRLNARDPETQAAGAVNDGLISNQFAQVLQAALARSGGEKALIDEASRSLDEERASPLKPVEEMLVTALHTSRATIRRMVERQAELEAEIAKEQKQAARLEWLLNRARADYSYFAALDKMNSESH